MMYIFHTNMYTVYLLSSLEGEHLRYIRCWMDVFRLTAETTTTSLVEASEASPQISSYHSNMDSTMQTFVCVKCSKTSSNRYRVSIPNCSYIIFTKNCMSQTYKYEMIHTLYSNHMSNHYINIANMSCIPGIPNPFDLIAR